MAEIMQVINVTSSTLSLTLKQHAQAIVTMNRAAGFTVTLPASSGSGAAYKIYVGTTLTGNGVIQVANATDILTGVVALATDIAGVTVNTTATDDTLTMSGSTTGGVKGSWVELIDVTTGLWAIRGNIIATGSEATPFSAAVS